MQIPCPNGQLIFGFPEEWESFRQRHTLFLERFENLSAALNAAFIRKIEGAEPIARFVMLYGRLCCEDFYEILLCCGNGYGIAATKLLRSLYERAVTLEYLNLHPEEFDAFMDYHHVSQHKLLTSLTEAFGADSISSNLREEAESEFKRVRKNFMIRSCDHCGTERLNHTWNKLDVVSMAKRTRILGGLITQAYYLPLRQGHSTSASLLDRLEQNVEGIGFDPGAQRSTADTVLTNAHLLILEVLDQQRRRFIDMEGFDEILSKCNRDWEEINNVGGARNTAEL